MFQRFSKPDRYLAPCGHLFAEMVERHVEGMPPFTAGLRVVFLSDVHVRPTTTEADLRALVGKIADARPQLLLLGGDYSDAASDGARFFHCLRNLSIPLGIYGVLGNNDAQGWAGQLRRLRRTMAAAGCRLLVNQAVNIPYNGGTIRLGGVDEYRYGHPDPDGLWAAEARGDLCRILLSHYPILPHVRPELMLCGHTHGGQFNLLGVTPYAVGFERFSRPRRASAAVAGLHDIDGMKLLVSKGIGASRLQLRVGVRPEMELLRFE